jgi:hypothetical protein
VATICIGPMALKKRVMWKLIEIEQPIQNVIEPQKTLLAIVHYYITGDSILKRRVEV